MGPIPIPQPERDPFEGLVLDQAFVRAAPIREDRLPSRRRTRVTALPENEGLAVVRAKVDGSAAPELTRRSLTLTALATLILIAGLALAGPGWQALSSAFGEDERTAHSRNDTTGAKAPMPAVPIPSPTAVPPSAAGDSTSSGTTSGPVLVDGQLVDPFRDPFSPSR